VTTTAVNLHHENETRVLSISVCDTPEQTRKIMQQLADDSPQTLDLRPWHALQQWMQQTQQGVPRVTIPYAKALADAIKPVAVRLRRDFGAILMLIRAHALLHQKTRTHDDSGSIVATMDDYAVVRALVADYVTEGAGATVSSLTRDTVEAVKRLSPSAEPVSVSAVARALQIDRSSASRRVNVALERGFLKNLETVQGRPFKLVIGDPLPADEPILPDVETLLHRCTGAGGVKPPPSPPTRTEERSPCPICGDHDFSELTPGGRVVCMTCLQREGRP
jgi:hypothetical protein